LIEECPRVLLMVIGFGRMEENGKKESVVTKAVFKRKYGKKLI
jgi:hypothetical protein